MRFSQFLPVTAIAAGLLAVPAVAQGKEHDDMRAEIRKIIREELKAAMKEMKQEQPGFGFTQFGASEFVDTDKDGLPDARKPLFVRTAKPESVDVKVDTDKIRKELKNVEVELMELDSLAKDIEKQVQNKVKARDAQKQDAQKKTGKKVKVAKTDGAGQFVIVDGEHGPATFRWAPSTDVKIEGFDDLQPKTFAWRVDGNAFHPLVTPKLSTNADGCCTITIRCENGACAVEVNGQKVDVQGGKSGAWKVEAPKGAKEPKAKKVKAISLGKANPEFMVKAVDGDGEEVEFEVVELTLDDVTGAIEIGAAATPTAECCEVTVGAAKAASTGSCACCADEAKATEAVPAAKIVSGECCESGEAKVEKAGECCESGAAKVEKAAECCESGEAKAEAKAKPTGDAGECCEGGCSGCAEEVKTTEVKADKKAEKSDKKEPTTVRRLLIGAR